MTSKPDRPSMPLDLALAAEQLRSSPMHVVAEILADTYAEALTEGIALAARGASEREAATWVRSRLPELEGRIPTLFGADSPYRPASIACLRAGVDLGYEAREARERSLRGEPVARTAPDGYEHADLPPQPAWLERQAHALVDAHAFSCELEGLEGIDPEQDLGTAREQMEPEVAHSVITDEGVHRVRSSFMRDVEDGRLYQIIAVREGREITVYRRYCGEADSVPVLAGFRTEELEFLRTAFGRMLAEITSTDDLLRSLEG